MNSQLHQWEEEWERDRLDPDNYFRIPEFDVSPADVDFHGFEGPIVSPTDDERAIRVEIRYMVRAARAFLREAFDSYRVAQDAELEFLCSVEDPKYEATPADGVVWCYFDCIRTLERALDHERPPLFKMHDLASAGAALGELGQLAAAIKESRNIEASVRRSEILAKFKKGGAA